MNTKSIPIKFIHGSKGGGPTATHPSLAFNIFSLGTITRFLLMCLCAFNTSAQEESRAWDDDFAVLRAHIEEVSPKDRLGQQKSRPSFEYDLIQQGHSEMEKPEAILKLMAILGALDEKSSHLDPFQERVQFHTLPLTLNWFESQLGVTETADSTFAPIGSRLTRIGQFSIEEIYSRFEKFLPGATEIERRNSFLTYVMIPELLRGLSIIEPLHPIQIAFVDRNGTGAIRELSPSDETRWKKGSNPTHAIGNLLLDPPENQGARFWTLDFPVDRSLYVHLRGMYSAKGQMSVSELTDSINFKLRTGGFDRVILDLRFGGGGSGDHMGPLVDSCRDFSAERQLIALIGITNPDSCIDFECHQPRAGVYAATGAVVERASEGA